MQTHLLRHFAAHERCHVHGLTRALPLIAIQDQSKRSFSSASPSPEFIKQVLKRSPFSIFSKAAPNTLPKYDVDKDFEYFFFADVMHEWSRLLPSFLTAGRNAKTDFPVDYEAYFKDDTEVCVDFPHPAVKDIVEPWGPPGMQSVLHTRKTGVDFGGQRYMLGCFVPFDDVELGVTTFRARKLAAEQPDLPHIPLNWYEQAFLQLPNKLMLVNGDSEVLAANLLVGEPAIFKDAIGSCLEKAKGILDLDASSECWEFGRVSVESMPYRVWVWRPVSAQDTFAIAFKPHFAANAAALPALVASALG